MSVRKWFAVPVLAAIVVLTLLVYGNVSAADGVSSGELTYGTLAEAVASVQSGSLLKLNRDMTETLTVGKNVTLDLNGCSIDGTVNVADGYTLKVKDSATDDFTSADGYGFIAATGNVQAAAGYIAIQEENGTSYHRLDLQISAVNLRPGAAAIYYSGNFGGDEAVKNQVEAYGTALSLTGTPTAREIAEDKHYSTHTAFSGESWVCGQTRKAHGTLLKGIWKQANSLQKNAENAGRKIYSVSYVQLKDGSFVLGAPVSMSLRDVVEKADTLWAKFDSQQVGCMQAMYREFESIMETWNIPNLQRSLSCQISVDYIDDGDETVTAVFSACGDVKLAMIELQLDFELSNASYKDFTVLAKGSAEANYVENAFYFSLISAEDIDITEQTELFGITFDKAAEGAEIAFCVIDSAVSDGTFTDIKAVSVVDAKYSG